MQQAAIALALCLAVGQGPASRIFHVEERVGTLVFVTANRAGATAYMSLRELEATGAFKLNLETPDLRDKLERESVNLSIEHEEAVTVARLIATAAGLDLIAERQTPRKDEEGPGQMIATVMPAPTNDTDAGRRQLRSRSLRWYRILLSSELRAVQESAEAEARVHIDMANLFLAQGDYASAADEFKRFVGIAPKDHPFVANALLELASCYLQLGQFGECDMRSRVLMAQYRDRDTGVRAAVLFAKANLGRVEAAIREGRGSESQKLLDYVVHTLELYLWGFRSRNEFPDLLLLIAEAHRLRKRPDLVLEKIRQLENVMDPILLSDELWAKANFLRGLAEVEAGNPKVGERLLWQFIQKRPGDPGVSTAWMGLAKAEMALEDPLQAVFAARKALERPNALSPTDRFDALIFEAKAFISLGKIDEASDRIEIEIRKYGPIRVPDLALYLGRVFLDTRRPERAKTVLSGLEHSRGSAGDQARVCLLEAEAMQGNHQQVVDLSLEFGDRILDADSQARMAELVGDAYAALGHARLAAEAYNGRIR